MTRPHALPLDGDALDRAEGHVVAVGFVRAGLVDDLLAQSRAALALEAERDALKAQVERMREALVVADVLIRKLLSGKVTDTGAGEVGSAIAGALYATPAQSLAAHDAEVRAKALREAAAIAREAQSRYRHDADMAAENDQPLQWSKHDGLAIAAEFIAAAILALAERAPEVER